MNQAFLLSILFRAFTILAVVASITFYVKGGNRLKLQSKEILKQQDTISTQSKTIEQTEAQMLSLKKQLQQSQASLRESERNLQLKDTELVVLRQQLQQNEILLNDQTQEIQRQDDENKRLKRETIELKTRKPVEPKEKQRLLKKIEKQQSIVEQLEYDLNESYLVLETLFSGSEQTSLKADPLE